MRMGSGREISVLKIDRILPIQFFSLATQARYSALIPASRTSLPHFAVSDLMNAPYLFGQRVEVVLADAL